MVKFLEIESSVSCISKYSNTFMCIYKSLFWYVITAWKVSRYGVIAGPYFSVFGPEITPYLNTFHAVYYCELWIWRLKKRPKFQLYYKYIVELEQPPQGVLRNNMFLMISQNSEQKSRVGVFFLINLQVWNSCSGVFLYILRNF